MDQGGAGPTTAGSDDQHHECALVQMTEVILEDL